MPRMKRTPRARRPPALRRSSYAAAGVSTTKEESGLQTLVQCLQETLTTRSTGLGHVKLPFGYFANVIDVGGMGLAISTDGVGSKLLVAQMLDRYDTVGIDCIAMNVNDVLCVGAEPLAMVDYIAVQEPNPRLLAELARGLRAGALTARITIPGGEIAQVRDIIKGARAGYGFDLAGTAVGTVPLDRILVGEAIEPDDVILGIVGETLAQPGYSKGAMKKQMSVGATDTFNFFDLLLRNSTRAGSPHVVSPVDAPTIE